MPREINPEHESLRLNAVKSGLVRQSPETYVRVDLTCPCYKVIHRYAQMRGMTASQVMFLAVRYSLYKEALDRPEVRRLFDEEGIDFDAKAVAQWQSYIDDGSTLDEIFSPIPEEAFEGGKGTILIALSMVGRYLFDAPDSPLDGLWRLTSTVVITGCLILSYGIVMQPEIIQGIFQQNRTEHNQHAIPAGRI